MFIKSLSKPILINTLAAILIVIFTASIVGCANQQTDAFRELSQNANNGWRLRMVPHPDKLTTKRIGFDLYNVYTTPAHCDFGGTDFANSIDEMTVNNRALRALKKCFEYQDAKGKYYYYYWAANDAGDQFIQNALKSGSTFQITLENMEFTFSPGSTEVVLDYLEKINSND